MQNQETELIHDNLQCVCVCVCVKHICAVYDWADVLIVMKVAF